MVAEGTLESQLQRASLPVRFCKNSTFIGFCGKVKCTLVQALRLCTGRTVYRGSRGIALPFHDHATRRGEGSASRPGCSLLPVKTQYPLYRKLSGPQGRSGQVRKISAPPGFDPRTYSPWPVAIPTELPGPLGFGILLGKFFPNSCPGISKIGLRCVNNPEERRFQLHHECRIVS